MSSYIGNKNERCINIKKAFSSKFHPPKRLFIAVIFAFSFFLLHCFLMGVVSEVLIIHLICSLCTASFPQRKTKRDS